MTLALPSLKTNFFSGSVVDSVSVVVSAVVSSLVVDSSTAVDSRAVVSSPFLPRLQAEKPHTSVRAVANAIIFLCFIFFPCQQCSLLIIIQINIMISPNFVFFK